MRGFKGLVPLLLIGFAGLAWLLFLSEPGSHWLTSFLSPPTTPGLVIGRVIALEGSLKRVHGGDVTKVSASPEKPLAPFDLHDGDRVETDSRTSVVVALNSKDEVELKSLTSVTFQLWNEQDPSSAVYMTLLAGDLDLRKEGVRGRAYVVRSGRLYLPSQIAAAAAEAAKPMALTVLRSAPLDMTLDSGLSEAAGDPENEGRIDSRIDNSDLRGSSMGGSDNTRDDFTPDSSSGANTATSGEPDRPDTGFSAEPETLSNEYIDEVIVSRQAQLQKCWLTRLKDKPNLKGQLMVQFEINRRGKVKEAKISESALNDEPLNKCVLTAFERLQFRTFKGPEISLTYPITFE